MLVCFSTLALALAAATPDLRRDQVPGSFAERSVKATKATSGTVNINGLRQDIEQAAGEIQTENVRARSDISKKEIKFTAPMQAKISHLTMDLDNLAADVQAKQSQLTEEATLVNEEAGAEKGKIEEGHAAAMEALNSASDAVKEKQKAMDTDQKSKSTENTFALGTQLAELQQKSNEETSETLEALQEAKDENEEAFDERVEEDKEVAEEKKEEAEEQDEIYEEAEEMVTEVSKEAKKGTAEANKEGNTLKRSIERAGPQIRRAGADAMKELNKNVEGLKKETLAELTDSHKDTNSELKELETMWKEGKREFDQEFKNTAKDAQQQLDDQNKDEDDILAEQSGVQNEANTVEAASENEFKALKDYKSESEDESENTLEELEQSVDGEQKSAAAVLRNEASDIASKAENKLSNAEAVMDQNRQDQVGITSAAISQEAGEILNDIHTNAAEAQQLVSTEKLEADSLASEAKAASTHLENSRETISSTKDKVKEVSETLDTSVNQVSAEFKTALENAKKEIDGYIQETNTAAKAESANALSATHELVAAAKQTLSSQVDEVEHQAKAGMVQDADYFKAQGTQLKDVVSDVRHATDTVSGMKADIEEQRGPAQNTAHQALGAIEEALAAARGSLDDAVGSLQTTLNGNVEKSEIHLNEEARRTSALLDEKQNGEAQKVQEELEGVQKLQRSLEAEETRSQQRSAAFQTDSRAQLDKSMKATGVMADENEKKAALSLEEVNSLIISIKEQSRKVMRDATDWSQKLTSQGQDTFDKELDQGEAVNKKTMQEADERIKAAANAAAEELAKDSDQVSQFVDSKDVDLRDLTTQESEAERDGAKLENEAKDKGSELQRDVYTIGQKEARIAGDVERAIQEHKTQTDAEKKSLEEMLKAKSKEQMTGFEQRLEQLGAEMKRTVGTDMTKYEMEETNMNSKMAAWQMKETGDKEGIEAGLKKTDMLAQLLGKTTKESTKAVSDEMRDLDEAVAIGADEMQQKLQQSDREVTGVGNGQLNGMEKIASGLGSLQDKADVLTSVLGDEVNEQSDFYANQANTKIDRVVQELNRVVESTPDLTSGFNEDTADTRTSLNGTLRHLLDASSRVDALIENMEGKLDDVRKDREAAALKVHGNISSLKVTAADKVGLAVTAISTMSREARNAKLDEMKRLRAFKHRLESMEGQQTNHKAGQFMEMESQMDKMESSHEHLLRWKMQNRHKTSAWRSEVNTQLQNIMSRIGANADEIKAAAVGEEMDLNKDLRAMQLRMEDEVADSSVSKANFFGQMVDGTLNDIQKMLGDEHKIDAEKDAMGKSADASLNSGKELVDAEVANVDDNQAELNQKAAALKLQMSTAMQQIQGEMALPMKTASGENRATEQRLSSLDSKLNSLSASLLETGQVDESYSERAFKEMHALNAQLERENARLKHQNARFAKGVAQVKRTHGIV